MQCNTVITISSVIVMMQPHLYWMVCQPHANTPLALLFDVMPFQWMVISQGFYSRWGQLATVKSLTDYHPLKWHHIKQQCHFNGW